MCHHYEFSSAREYEHEHTTDDETAEEVTADFDEADDVEILTDGGDADEE